MTILDVSSRICQPGSTGWSIEDLSDPAIEHFWEGGSYEIIEGVLSTMPPAYGDGTIPLGRLQRAIHRHLDANNIAGDFMTEPDLILSPMRIVKPDLMFMTADDLARQRAAHAAKGEKPELKYGRFLVLPTLIIESISLSHERHDEQTKRQWYAEARVPNYWIVDGFRKTLNCLVLDGNANRVDCSSPEKQILSPTVFPGLTIAVESLWA